MKALNVKEAEETLNSAFQDAARGVRHLQHSTEDAIEETRHTIKTRPLTAVLGAAALGVLTGIVIAWVVGKRS